MITTPDTLTPQGCRALGLGCSKTAWTVIMIITPDTLTPSPSIYFLHRQTISFHFFQAALSLSVLAVALARLPAATPLAGVAWGGLGEQNFAGGGSRAAGAFWSSLSEFFLSACGRGSAV